jgi:hypothetical protein
MVTAGLLFWLIFIIGTIFVGFGFYRTRTIVNAPAPAFDFTPLVWWVLILLLGIGTFGSALGLSGK